MTRAHLTSVFADTVQLAQQRRAIFVDVSVLTESGEWEASVTSGLSEVFLGGREVD